MFESFKRIFTYNSSRTYLASFASRAASSIPNDARVLDAGAGEGPYRSVFNLAQYESTDICMVNKNYGKISYISDLNHIPVQSDCYDLVFCSQTLEHVPEPKKVISEIYRVLKPGGKLWLTAPFFFAEHGAPLDYYRYSQYGLRYILEGGGFEVERIEWLEGYFGTLSYQLKVAAKALPLKPGDFGPGLLSWIVIPLIGVLKGLFAILIPFFSWLDVRSKYVSKGQCKNYAIIALKGH